MPCDDVNWQNNKNYYDAGSGEKVETITHKTNLTSHFSILAHSKYHKTLAELNLRHFLEFRP